MPWLERASHILSALRGSGLRVLAAAAALAAILLLRVAPLPAQEGEAASGPKIERIQIQGYRRFSSEDLAAVLGLRLGQAVNDSLLNAAASRLAQTGAFRDVSYEFSRRGDGWSVRFVVVEFPEFLPCVFDNLLWFEDADLIAAARARVSLFNGLLPEGNTAMQDQVIAALQQFLDAHHVAGSVAITPISRGLGAKPESYSIHVTDVPMPVLRVEVKGGPPDAVALGEATRGLVGSDYSRHFAVRVAETALTEAYQDEGYLQPKFSEPMPSFQDPAGKDASQGVIVRYLVTPGLRYSWAGVGWSGNHALTAEELTKLVAVLPGELARRNRTLAGWDEVREAFAHKGYITARLDPVPQFDDQTASVRFEVNLAEGPQFHMGELRVDDPSEKAAKELAAAWPLQRGAVFDAAAEKEFLRSGAGKALARAGVTSRQYRVERDLHHDTATVNVLIRTNQ